MSTRRIINKILKAKNLIADIEYERAGPDYYSWWTIAFDDASADFIRQKLDEPEFTGSIEFCEIEDGIEQLNEMPRRK